VLRPAATIAKKCWGEKELYIFPRGRPQQQLEQPIRQSLQCGRDGGFDKIERRCWVGYRSGKAAEISYATIQGREALIQKFRNSSVMQETPFCRPRLFYTGFDPEVPQLVGHAGVCIWCRVALG